MTRCALGWFLALLAVVSGNFGQREGIAEPLVDVQARVAPERSGCVDLVQLEDGSFGCAPSFFVMGAQKAGTSHMAKVMLQHPQIQGAGEKETHFFSSEIDVCGCFAGCPLLAEFAKLRSDAVWNQTYPSCVTSSRMPACRKTNQRPGYTSAGAKKYAEAVGYRTITPHMFEAKGLVNGEFDATYFHNPCVSATIDSHMPHAKFIVILRHPITRALSRVREQALFANTQWNRYNYGIDYFEGASSFDRYVEMQVGAVEKCMRWAGSNLRRKIACANGNTAFGWSLYDVFLEHMLETIAADRVLLVLNEHMRVADIEVAHQVEHHLGVDRFSWGLQEGQNSTGLQTNAAGAYGQGVQEKAGARKRKTCRERLAVAASMEVSGHGWNMLWQRLYAPMMLRLAALLTKFPQLGLSPESATQAWDPKYPCSEGLSAT